MPVAAEGIYRSTVAVRKYSFHREYINHDVFQVSITDREGTFVYQVRAWGNMVNSVHAFTTSIAHIGVCQRAKRDIFMTGYGSVNGINVRVTPLG